MGSERLSHMFSMKDPTAKENSSISKHKDEKSSSQHSISHTSGTHPVSISNGPKSSPTSTLSIMKHQQKSNSKYKKLLKLYSQQLSHIETSLNAIESLSKMNNNEQNKIFLSNKKHLEKLNNDLENLRNSPSIQDHTQFDQIKNDIEQLINNLKSYKMKNDNNNDSLNTIDYLFGFPLNVSDSENDEEKTLVYF